MPHLISGMTSEQQIGQLFTVGFPGTTASPEVLDLIQRDFVGGVIFFSRNLRNARQTLALTQELQAAARAAGHPYPLLIMTDQENGLVRRLGADSTIFPGNMALGAVGSEQLVHDVARAAAAEVAAQGVNMNLAPVVDVNNNPANPVIGIRSFGEDPDAVARLGAAAVRGYRAGGVIATLKHFPGHGDTAADSHRVLPAIPATLERLDAVELLPFRHGIAAGAECVLIAHVALPALDPPEPAPATLSRRVVQGLLRERLGFDGVVVSDCLEMDAIARTVGTARGAVLALQAGIDIVLVSHRLKRQRASLDAVRAAAAAGELDPATVTAAAARVLRLKRLTHSWRGLPDESGLTAVGGTAHRELAARAYESTVTVVRDEAGLLPLRLAASDWLLVISRLTETITRAVDIGYAPTALVDALRRSHPHVETLTLPIDAGADAVAAAVRAARAADVVLLVTLNAHLDPTQRDVLRDLAAAGRTVIGLAVCDPYDAGALPEMPTFLLTYEYSPPALAAAARVLLGQAEARGKAPITLARTIPS
jgi:beta-N-acetylhexosaminidase